MEWIIGNDGNVGNERGDVIMQLVMLKSWIVMWRETSVVKLTLWSYNRFVIQIISWLATTQYDLMIDCVRFGQDYSLPSPPDSDMPFSLEFESMRRSDLLGGDFCVFFFILFFVTSGICCCEDDDDGSCVVFVGWCGDDSIVEFLMKISSWSSWFRFCFLQENPMALLFFRTFSFFFFSSSLFIVFSSLFCRCCDSVPLYFFISWIEYAANMIPVRKIHATIRSNGRLDEMASWVSFLWRTAVHTSGRD